VLGKRPVALLGEKLQVNRFNSINFCKLLAWRKTNVLQGRTFKSWLQIHQADKGVLRCSGSHLCTLHGKQHHSLLLLIDIVRFFSLTLSLSLIFSKGKFLVGVTHHDKIDFFSVTISYDCNPLHARNQGTEGSCRFVQYTC
jgi:hypothetical protein